MYFRLLRKDLRRKKTLNVIMLIFMILASTFIASSMNNMITVASALDDYFELAGVPDYWTATTYKGEAERLREFTEENGYGLDTIKLIQVDPRDTAIEGEKFEYENTLVLSAVGGTKIFDSMGKEITHVADGEIYVSSEIFHSADNDFYEGCKITINANGVKKDFTLKGYTKDALFGSAMMGMTRFLVSDGDFALFDVKDSNVFYSCYIHMDDNAFMDKFNNLSLKSTINADRPTMKMMYIMDTLVAAVILIVSLCLILISMVILRFTILFTMSEEFREIGVMKAIGIPNSKIRGLYIVKYFAISFTGALIGLLCSFPFSSMLLKSVGENILISGQGKYYLNIICAIGTAAAIVLFCYFCTRKIKKFSPIDAIRNGEKGERYSKKGFLLLSKSKLPPVPFMALNDIFSNLKSYISMILIFTLGLLLIILPVNTINTLQSDSLITCFNMAECDTVISQELLFSANGQNKEKINENMEHVRKVLNDNNIPADVFQEILFRFTISHGDKKSSSLSFIGVGEVTANQYSYLEGTPPQREGEVAITFVTAEQIGADIGDTVEIDIGSGRKKYIVTALNQSMNNLGEGIRFYEKEDLDFNFAAGYFGTQISYRDNPDKKIIRDRMDVLKKAYPESNIYSAGEYISYMIGNVADQIKDIKNLILGIIIGINILIAILMVRSFITREKREIALLKAIGFQNSSLIAWQSLRIGIVLLLSILIGTAISAPLSTLAIEPIFRMMGAYSIQFDIVKSEVYVLYPVIVFFATVFAAAIGAWHLRKIAASETSNNE